MLVTPEELEALLPAALLDRASVLSAASLHEASGRLGALPANLRPLTPLMRVVGRALPVRSPAGDNLWLHHALIAAQPRDVLVVDTGAGLDFGYWGEIMATAAAVRGVAGLVIIGGVRDMLRLIEIGVPTFSVTITIQGTVKNLQGDGAVGEPVRIGEVMVRRGDLIFGDADGVVALNPALAAAAVARAEQRDADEIHILERIRAGASTLDIYDFTSAGVAKP